MGNKFEPSDATPARVVANDQDPRPDGVITSHVSFRTVGNKAVAVHHVDSQAVIERARKTHHPAAALIADLQPQGRLWEEFQALKNACEYDATLGRNSTHTGIAIRNILAERAGEDPDPVPPWQDGPQPHLFRFAQLTIDLLLEGVTNEERHRRPSVEKTIRHQQQSAIVQTMKGSSDAATFANLIAAVDDCLAAHARGRGPRAL